MASLPMLQTHLQPMSTSYRATTPQEFFDINNQQQKANSLIDQLGLGLKSSLKLIWNYLKAIDVKKALPLINYTKLQPEKVIKQYPNQTQLAQQKPNTLTKKTTKQCRHKQGHLLSKKQRIQQKKQRKKIISFDSFTEQQDRRLNQSCIRKNIENKRALNKSILTQNNQQEKHLFQNHNKSTSLPPLKKDTTILNQNQSILNISDIDSECNFNILNNSDLYDSNQKNQIQLLNKNDSLGGNLALNCEMAQNDQPKLQLTEYPFLIPERKYPILKIKNYKPKFSHKNTKTKSSNIQFEHQSLLQSLEPSQKDADNFRYPHQQPFEKKRDLPLQANHSEIKTHKRVNKNIEIENFQFIMDKKTQMKHEKFDRLVQSRYQKMVYDLLMVAHKGDELSMDQPVSLKQDYENFISKNFGAMQYIKKRIQNQSKFVTKSSQVPISEGDNQKQSQNISQILKPLDMSPMVERKKLYNFTRQCESKIKICDQLKKSVQEDKQRQMIEQIRKKKQEEERIKRQEQQSQRKQYEEMLLVQQEQRKRKQKQEEALRIAEQIQNQQQQKQTPVLNLAQNQYKAEEQRNQKQGQQKTQAQVAKKSASETNPEETGLKESKQPAKISKLFQSTKGQLSTLPPPKDSSQTSPNQKNEAQPKQTELININQTQKKNQQPQKFPQALDALQKKQSHKSEKKQAKFNPFLAASTKPPQITKLQEIINSKKDDNSLFKTVICNQTITSPQHQPPQQSNSNSFLSPVHNHNTSHYTNLDSSMCEQSESNITPGNSQVLGNLGAAQNLNGSFLNNSFSSLQQNSSLFPTQNNSNSLFNGNAGSSLFGSAYNPTNTGGLFGNAQPPQKPQTSSGLFGNIQTNMFMSNPTVNPITQAVTKVPSFMQGHPSISPSINSQNAVSLFNQRSPSKNQSQSLFAAPIPTLDNKRGSTRRDKKSREERIR